MWDFSLFHHFIPIQVSEAAIRGVLREKVFLEISQKSQENNSARVFFLIKWQSSGLFYKTSLVAASKVFVKYLSRSVATILSS